MGWRGESILVIYFHLSRRREAVVVEGKGRWLNILFVNNLVVLVPTTAK
jgi:hypothetical protein